MKCRHFIGIQHDFCEANVDMEKLERIKTVSGYRVPCLRHDGATYCKSFELETAAEIEQRELDFRARFQRSQTAKQAIISHSKDTKRNSGEMVCPICGASLRFSIAQCNGHVHARCKTPDCVSFME